LHFRSALAHNNHYPILLLACSGLLIITIGTAKQTARNGTRQGARHRASKGLTALNLSRVLRGISKLDGIRVSPGRASPKQVREAIKGIDIAIARLEQVDYISQVPACERLLAMSTPRGEIALVFCADIDFDSPAQFQLDLLNEAKLKLQQGATLTDGHLCTRKATDAFEFVTYPKNGTLVFQYCPGGGDFREANLVR